MHRVKIPNSSEKMQIKWNFFGIFLSKYFLS